MAQKESITRWTMAAIVDYEVLLAALPESEQGEQQLAEWFHSYEGRGRPADLLRAWVEASRAGGGDLFVGASLGAVYTVACVAVSVLALMAGLGLGWGVLAYQGESAVNLLVSLGVLVGVPACFSLLSLVLMLVPGNRRTVDALARWQWSARWITRWLVRLRVFSRQRADRVEAASVLLMQRSSCYRMPLRWSVTLPWQLRGFLFNSGVLLAVFFKGVFQDLAFAWQTTLNVSPGRAHAAARLVAWPWRAWGGVPSVDQVAGSRVVQKEGIETLLNSDLAAWWPYLCLAVLCYGVLPRFVLLVSALVGRAFALRSLAFRDSRSRRLLAAMRGHQLVVDGREPDREETALGPLQCDETDRTPGSHVVVLLPREREELAADAAWVEMVKRRWGATVERVCVVNQDDEDDAAVLAELPALDPGVWVLVLMEGWRPYTVSAGLFLSAVAEAAGEERMTVAGLVGSRDGEMAVSADSYGTWRDRVRIASAGRVDVVVLEGGEDD